MIMDNKPLIKSLMSVCFSSDEVSVKIGEQLKLDVLSNADKVQHQNETSAERTEIWSRSDRVQSDRLTDNRNLIISNFTARDAGTYRVLDSEGEILITQINATLLTILCLTFHYPLQNQAQKVEVFSIIRFA
uniref:Immunoglobulin subtype domain-containing protein n=1 Tax=Sinocyclocheilus rhinocerous TaxID=307959 RepID=A0A673IIT3_9TELE